MATVPTTIEVPEELEIVAAGEELPEQVTLWQDAWRRLTRNRMAVVGLVIIAIFIVTSLVSFVWTPYPTWRQALGPTYQGPTLLHPFGLDDFGAVGDSLLCCLCQGDGFEGRFGYCQDEFGVRSKAD